MDSSAEVFSHAPEGFAAAQTEASTMIDAGGYYHFKSPGLQLLFAYGHSIAGQTENYAYLGLYKTWGKDKGKPESPTDAMQSAHPPSALDCKKHFASAILRHPSKERMNTNERARLK